MKLNIYFLLMTILFFSACKKQAPTGVNKGAALFLSNVGSYLNQHMDNCEKVDFTQYHISKLKTRRCIRLALKSKPVATDFIVLETDSNGIPSAGRVIHIETAIDKTYKVNGSVVITSLDGRSSIVSRISQGFIEAFHPGLFVNNTREQSLPYPYDDLPEVIVVAYRPSSGSGYNIGTYMSMLSALSGGGSNGSAYYPDPMLYIHVDVNGYYGGGEVSSGGGSNATPETGNHMDYYMGIEESPSRPAIDLDAWIKCFTDIPDEGATCSITICADLPDDNDPGVAVNFYSGATGHTFLQLRKTNGAQSVTQIIGFTAVNAVLAIAHADEFVPGKLVDNADHKYNASITMNVNASAFNTALGHMKLLSASTSYSITRFDCLDFDLSVINSIRGNNPLVLPKVYTTGNTFDAISTGERFYAMLSDMKAYGDPEASNIYAGGPQFIGKSHGPCN